MSTPHILIEHFTNLRLPGMRAALEHQEQHPQLYQERPFYDRLQELLHAEQEKRQAVKISTRLRHARLHECVPMESLDFSSTRGLSKTLCLELANAKWVKQPQNILIVGATGTGKTYLACTLTHQACAHQYSARYYRLPRLLHELELAEHNGSLPKLLQLLAKQDVLILDDWGLTPFTDKQRRHVLEVLDDRYHQRATIVTSQLPVQHWHDYINEPTLADAILDRLVHGAQPITLKGDSLRKKMKKNSHEELTGE